ncbi:MAG: DNA integrity scanning protein DisA nucleotide-binding domain protein [Clostridia bacterium]|nr:DNA integrity scanning protein DisA nucleotide-binding domain protein [Clostridia bacterium]
MARWKEIVEIIKQNFGTGFANNWLTYVLQLIMFTILYYLMFKVLRNNKADKFVGIIVFFIVLTGVALAFSARIDSGFLFIIIVMIALLVFTMFHTEIKRSLLDSGIKKKGKAEPITVTGVELIMDEIVRAVQNMSKNDIGALMVLSNGNLPDEIIESGTKINASITSQMVEAIFYPKAPLHDGALIIEGNKLYAAGCFLPLAQDERLPKEMGSRHRAALGVTMVASVTAIVVSEETGIISIVKNGVIKKKYADATDIKEALSDYYWSDLTAESVI